MLLLSSCLLPLVIAWNSCSLVCLVSGFKSFCGKINPLYASEYMEYKRLVLLRLDLYVSGLCEVTLNGAQQMRSATLD
ncbi:hypothetical protein Tco_0564517 [Tanacetum coccineum]